MSSAQDHRWTFVATGAEGQPGAGQMGEVGADQTSAGQSGALLVAVCERCGTVRTSGLPTPGYERHINIVGTCPGVPQPAERSGRATKLEARDN